MHDNLSLKEIQNKWHGNLKSYLIGFVVSLLLTTTSFFIVITKQFSGPTLIGIIVALAFVQAMFQMFFFMHLGQEDKPYWESIAFYSMVIVLLVIVLGSLWIMYDLDDRLMSGMEMGMTGMTHD